VLGGVTGCVFTAGGVTGVVVAGSLLAVFGPMFVRELANHTRAATATTTAMKSVQNVPAKRSLLKAIGFLQI
jgi:hypothetical protein